MSITITAPNGAKVRSSSMRRYVLIGWRGPGPMVEPSAVIVKRSDSVATLKAVQAKMYDPTRHFIFDQRDGVPV